MAAVSAGQQGNACDDDKAGRGPSVGRASGCTGAPIAPGSSRAVARARSIPFGRGPGEPVPGRGTADVRPDPDLRRLSVASVLGFPNRLYAPFILTLPNSPSLVSMNVLRYGVRWLVLRDVAESG